MDNETQPEMALIKKIKTPETQIGYVCGSLPEHLQDSRDRGYELRPNGSGFEIWQPEISEMVPAPAAQNTPA